MNKTVRKLQIKLLSRSGELLNCINCYAGQVSVFRATSNIELAPYLRALSGTTGPERFVVELDGESFIPHEHTLIGFGERFLGNEGNVSDFLIAQGVPQFGVDSLLLTFGLEKVVHTKCHLLSRCEERRLRLIAATYSDKGVLIAQEPFDPVSSEWREKFAELIAAFARNHKQIVIIPSLSYRPQCWIDNENVARIQVGQSIQKTVGFGSGDTNVQSLVNQMREIFKDQKAAEEFLSKSGGFTAPSQTHTQHPPITTEPTTDSSSIKTFQKISSENQNLESEIEIEDSPEESKAYKDVTYKDALLDYIYDCVDKFNISPRMIGLATISLLVLIVASFWPVSNKGDPTSNQIATVTENPSIPPVNNDANPIQADIDQEQVVPEQNPPPTEQVVNVEQPVVPPVQENIQNTPPTPSLILAAYPAPIHDAVVQAFEGSGGIITSAGSGNADQTKKPAQQSKQASEASDFLRLLKYAENSAENNSNAPVDSYSDIPPPIPQDGSPFAEENMDEQQRREAIRQKFLEAIQRAQERRGESGE